MDHLELHVEGKTYGKSGSGFAVIMRSKHNEWKRSFAYGNYSANQAELLAVKFALLSVVDPNIKVKIFAKNKYVRDMLERDENGHYVKRVSANKEFIDDVRSLIENKNIEIVKSEGDTAAEITKMVQDAVKEGVLVDSRE
jgi:hypothetical protein